MAVSNAEGRLVLATGNKSELSVGYCTLYGDTVGGLAVLGDVYKRDVYALARAGERLGRERIPQPHTIDKPPSAELAPDQLDSDDLPDVRGPGRHPRNRPSRESSAATRPASSRQPGATAEIVREVHRAGGPQRVQAPSVARSCSEPRRKAFGLRPPAPRRPSLPRALRPDTS